MPSLASKKSNHISNIVSAVVDLLDAVNTLQGLQLEANAVGYTTGGANALVDADFVGTNSYLDAAAYNAAITALTGLNVQLNTVPTGGASVYSILYALKP